MRHITILLTVIGLGLLAGIAQAAPVTFVMSEPFLQSGSDLDGTMLNASVILYTDDDIGVTGSTINGSLQYQFGGPAVTITQLYIGRLSMMGGGSLQGVFALRDTPAASDQSIGLTFQTSDGSELSTVSELQTAFLNNNLQNVGFKISEPGQPSDIDGYFQNVSQVPLPAAVWLFSSALAGFVAISRRRQSRA